MNKYDYIELFVVYWLIGWLVCLFDYLVGWLVDGFCSMELFIGLF